MIDIKIFEVEQGFCAAIDAYNDLHIMIDCGSGSHFNPSRYIWQKHYKSLDYLVLPAYTKNHLAGFPELVDQSWQHNIPIHFLVFNPTINPAQFNLKPFPAEFGNSLTSLTDTSQTMQIDDLKLTFFWNKYSDFQSPHNLSLITFVQYKDINLILPGDLENDGWQKLLQSDNFRQKLERVNIFVAANHGEESGYCHEVFRYCHPEIVIISNKEDKPISPQMMDKYEVQAKGTPSQISDKKVLTTYCEGTITISKYLDGRRNIRTQHDYQPSAYLK